MGLGIVLRPLQAIFFFTLTHPLAFHFDGLPARFERFRILSLFGWFY
jgi:hypothetical protein